MSNENTTPSVQMPQPTVQSPVVPEPETANDLPLPDEKTVLLQRARMMGISVSNNSSVETLKAKIAKKIAADENDGEDDETETPKPIAVPPAMATPPAQTLRQKLMEENMRLVRLRITNLDPKKKNLPGEIITVANKYIGTVRKYIPFGEATENGYHVPYCIYKLLKSRKFLHVRVVKVKNGQDRIETSNVPEFSLEVLPQLTEKDLRKLALQQAAAAGNLSE